MDSKSQFLRSVELLSTLSEAERLILSELLLEVSYEAGETLWMAGDDADCALLIRKGTVEVKESAFTNRGEGNERQVPTATATAKAKRSQATATAKRSLSLSL